MRTADPASRRASSSARWMALEGALCALLLAVVAGVCSMSARALEHKDTRWVTAAREPQRKSSLSAHFFGQQRLIGVHAAPSQGHLELPRPAGGKPPPLHQRSHTRPSPALRPEALLAERTRRQLSCVLPTSHGRVADRPVVANCPAQGPPRAA